MVKVKGIVWCFLVIGIIIHMNMIMAWVSATRIPNSSPPFLVTHHHQDKGHLLQSPQLPFVPKQGVEDAHGMEEEEAYYWRLSRLGSRPPNCEHKCRGCKPCVAIQVPTPSHDDQLVSPQFTNYQPEGWKCKCGSFLFNP